MLQKRYALLLMFMLIGFACTTTMPVPRSLQVTGMISWILLTVILAYLLLKTALKKEYRMLRYLEKIKKIDKRYQHLERTVKFESCGFKVSANEDERRRLRRKRNRLFDRFNYYAMETEEGKLLPLRLR